MANIGVEVGEIWNKIVGDKVCTLAWWLGPEWDKVIVARVEDTLMTISNVDVFIINVISMQGHDKRIVLDDFKRWFERERY